VTTPTTDPNPANNLSTATVVAYVPVSISAAPTNQVTSVGGSATFYVSAALQIVALLVARRHFAARRMVATT
jgi:hypothetical protein